MAQTLTAVSSFHLRFPRDTRLRDLLATWRRRMAEQRQLAQFDARALQDLGLTDVDRAAIIATPFWREPPRLR